MKIVLIIITLTGCFVGIMYLFPQINFREIPKGLLEGQLSEGKPNWVSSFVSPDNSHYIAPLKVNDIGNLSQCIKNNIAGVNITKTDKLYVLGYRQSRIFHFVDWFIIHSDGNVASSATMGHSDLGKNKDLIEQIRSLCN